VFPDFVSWFCFYFWWFLMVTIDILKNSTVDGILPPADNWKTVHGEEPPPVLVEALVKLKRINSNEDGVVVEVEEQTQQTKKKVQKIVDM